MAGFIPAIVSKTEQNHEQKFIPIYHINPLGDK